MTDEERAAEIERLNRIRLASCNGGVPMAGYAKRVAAIDKKLAELQPEEPDA